MGDGQEKLQRRVMEERAELISRGRYGHHQVGGKRETGGFIFPSRVDGPVGG